MKLILIIMVITLGLAGAWLRSIYQNRNLQHEISEENAKIGQNEREIERLSNELKKVQSKTQTEIGREESVIAQISEDIQARRSTLDSLFQKLGAVKNSMGTENNFLDRTPEVAKKKALIADLERQLQVTRTRREKYGGDTHADQLQGKLNEKQNEEIFARNIRDQSAKIKDLTQQINTLKKNRYDYQALQRAKDLEPELEQQKTAFTNLQAQKQNYTQTWNSEINLSKTNADQQLALLRKAETDLSDQLRNEKTTLSTLEVTINQAHQILKSERDGLSSLQKTYDEQLGKISALQVELKRHHDLLRELRGKN